MCKRGAGAPVAPPLATPLIVLVHFGTYIPSSSTHTYYNTNNYKNEVGMTVPKSKDTRLVSTNIMEHPVLHHFDAGPLFHFGSQNNVAGMLHYTSSHQPCHYYPYFPEQLL